MYRLCIASFGPKLWKKVDLALLTTKHKHDFEPYWQDEKDWLCIVLGLALGPWLVEPALAGRNGKRISLIIIDYHSRGWVSLNTRPSSQP